MLINHSYWPLFTFNKIFFQVSCNFSMIFIIYCKIPWYFQVFQVYSHFSRFSSKCGNPAHPTHRPRPLPGSTPPQSPVPGHFQGGTHVSGPHVPSGGQPKWGQGLSHGEDRGKPSGQASAVTPRAVSLLRSRRTTFLFEINVWRNYLVLMFLRLCEMLAWLFLIRWPSSQMTRSGPGRTRLPCIPTK